MKNLIIFFHAILLLPLLHYTSSAQQNVSFTPRTISYQRYLTDNAKTPLRGIHTVLIKLYDAPLEGKITHTESFQAKVEEGVFSVLIGSITPIDSSLEFNKQYWLGVTIDEGEELSPRTEL